MRRRPLAKICFFVGCACFARQAPREDRQRRALAALLLTKLAVQGLSLSGHAVELLRCLTRLGKTSQAFDQLLSNLFVLIVESSFRIVHGDFPHT